MDNSSDILSAVKVAELVNSGAVSARDICERALQMAENDSNNSFITVTRDEALAAAKRVDMAVSDGRMLPLAGVPVSVKDNICTEGIRTTCASEMLKEYIPDYSATVYARLIEAGCVLIGKNNLDEFAMGSEGSSSAFGKTENPKIPGKIPGGSSSGSAAAVAEGIVSAALGSDTGGSARQPAGLCSLVSMKATYGRVSRWGLVAFAPSMDSICPITRSVRDTATVLAAIEGEDCRDMSMIHGLERIDSVPCAKAPRRLGIWIPDKCSSATVKSIEKASSLLSDSGTEADTIVMPYMDTAVSVYYVLSSAEALSCLARYDGVRFGASGGDEGITEVRSRAFGKTVKQRLNAGAAVLTISSSKNAESGFLYRTAAEYRRKLTEEFDSLFEKYDVILTPTTPMESYAPGEFDMDRMNTLPTVYANLTGAPAITLPMGCGIQLMAARGKDNALLRTAMLLEEGSL